MDSTSAAVIIVVMIGDIVNQRDRAHLEDAPCARSHHDAAAVLIGVVAADGRVRQRQRSAHAQPPEVNPSALTFSSIAGDRRTGDFIGAYVDQCQAAPISGRRILAHGTVGHVQRRAVGPDPTPFVVDDLAVRYRDRRVDTFNARITIPKDHGVLEGDIQEWARGMEGGKSTACIGVNITIGEFKPTLEMEDADSSVVRDIHRSKLEITVIADAGPV